MPLVKTASACVQLWCMPDGRAVMCEPLSSEDDAKRLSYWAQVSLTHA